MRWDACEFLAWATREGIDEPAVPGLDSIRRDAVACEAWTRESLERINILEKGPLTFERLPVELGCALASAIEILSDPWTEDDDDDAGKPSIAFDLPDHVAQQLRVSLERFRDILPARVSDAPVLDAKAWRAASKAFEGLYSANLGLMRHSALTVTIATAALVSRARSAMLAIATLTTDENMVFAAEVASFGVRGLTGRGSCEIQMNIEAGVNGENNPFGRGKIKIEVGGDDVWCAVSGQAKECGPAEFEAGLTRLSESPEECKLFVLVNHVSNGLLEYEGVKVSGADTGASFRRGLASHPKTVRSTLAVLGITCGNEEFIESWGALPRNTFILAFSIGKGKIRTLAASHFGPGNAVAAAAGVGVARVLDRLLAANPDVMIVDVPRLVRLRFQAVLIDPWNVAPGRRLIEFYHPLGSSVRLFEADELPPTPASQSLIEHGKLSLLIPPLRSGTTVGGDDASLSRALLKFGRPLEVPDDEVQPRVNVRLTSL